MESMQSWRPLVSETRAMAADCPEAADDLSLLSSYLDIDGDLLLPWGPASPAPMISLPFQEEHWSLDHDEEDYGDDDDDELLHADPTVHDLDGIDDEPLRGANIHSMDGEDVSMKDGGSHNVEEFINSSPCKDTQHLERVCNTFATSSIVQKVCKPMKESFLNEVQNKRHPNNHNASTHDGSLSKRSMVEDKIKKSCSNGVSTHVEAAYNRKSDTHGAIKAKSGLSNNRFWKRGLSSESLNKSPHSSENDCIHISEDDHEGNKFCRKRSKCKKGSMSKNLESERNRRLKLNERLYSLRALVPNISKMDKASIVGDAINYVRDLKKQVEDMEGEISQLEACKEDMKNGMPHPYLHHRMVNKRASCHVKKPTKLSYKILELDVTQMEEKLFQFRIHCKKTPGILLQLARALEALDFEIVNGSFTSINDHVLNTLVIEANGAHLIGSEDLRAKTLVAIQRFGLFL